MPKKRDVSAYRVATFVVFAASAMPASALDIGMRAAYSEERSDNIRLVAVDRESDFVDVGRLAIVAVERSSQQFNVQAFSQIERRRYRHGSFPDETVGLLNASAIWTISPKKLSWIAEDYFGQALVDVSAPATPSNLQNVNVFALGPNTSFRLSERSTADIALRYANFYARATDNDANRYAAMTSLNYDLSQVSALSFNYDVFAVNQRAALYPDYTRHNIFLGAKRRLPHSSIEMRVGKSFTSTVGEGSTEDNYAQALWQHPMSARSEMRISLTKRPQDSADAVLAATAIGGMPPIANAARYRFEEVDIAYTRRRSNVGDDLRFVRQRLRYDGGVQPDEERIGGFVDLGIELSETIYGGLFANYLHTDFIQTDIATDDSVGGARLQYRLRRNVAVGVEVRSTRRVSNDPLREYREARTMFTIGYNSNPAVVAPGHIESSLAR